MFGGKLFTFKFLPIGILCALGLLCGGGALCAADVRLAISVPDQRMALVQDGVEVARYRISTSRFGLGDQLGSYATPTGLLEVAQKIGDRVQEGTVFKSRRPTGEVLPPNAPGRDPIVTRILWLRGLESNNVNSHKRCIYIHGTPEEKFLGKPVSWGCIRMGSKDVMKVYDAVAVGAKVEIAEKRLKVMVKEYSQSFLLAQNRRDANAR
jgi:lipoprotein-anchoring transpeptidase ErfK/SrfK